SIVRGGAEKKRKGERTGEPDPERAKKSQPERASLFILVRIIEARVAASCATRQKTHMSATDSVDDLVQDSGLEAAPGEGPSGLVGMEEAAEAEAEAPADERATFLTEARTADREHGGSAVEEHADSSAAADEEENEAGELHELDTIREDTTMEKAEEAADVAAENADEAEADEAVDGEAAAAATEAPPPAESSKSRPSSRRSSKPPPGSAGRVRRERTIESLLDNDELWDTDLEDELPEEGHAADLHDTTGRSLYRTTCERLGAVPVKYFLKHLTDTRLIMRHHGLGPVGTRAIARPLAINLTITELDLTGNWMEPEGGRAIAKMLEENSYITHLWLADNKLCDEGAAQICRVLQTNSASVTHLSLAGNEIGDQAADSLFDLLANNRTLVSLNLSRNCLGGEAAARLGAGLGINDYLEELDLSGNRISGPGAVELAQGIRESFRLKKCNLAWNGFAEEGGRALADMLKANQALQELNIEGNRLNGNAAVAIGNAVAGNEILLELRMGNNFLYTAELLQVVKLIVASETTPLTFLSFKDIPVDYEFVKTVEQQMRRTTRDFQCEHGPVLRAGNTRDELAKPAIDIRSPIVLLREHILINDFRFVERLAAMDAQGNGTVSLEQFAAVMDEMKIPYYRSQLSDLVAKLDKLGDGSIYYADFMPPERPRRESAMIRSRGAMT
uniref:EF-hand domain-containing protein n=1 Tax=Macrostomum lignano TaxID=282301 RepID=A0A1I8H5G9_9PLAT